MFSDMVQNAYLPTIRPTRRTFLKLSVGTSAGLVLGAHLPVSSAAASQRARDTAAFNPFVHIAPNGTVTVLIKHLDKG